MYEVSFSHTRLLGIQQQIRVYRHPTYPSSCALCGHHVTDAVVSRKTPAEVLNVDDVTRPLFGSRLAPLMDNQGKAALSQCTRNSAPPTTRIQGQSYCDLALSCAFALHRVTLRSPGILCESRLGALGLFGALFLCCYLSTRTAVSTKLRVIFHIDHSGRDVCRVQTDAGLLLSITE